MKYCDRITKLIWSKIDNISINKFHQILFQVQIHREYRIREKSEVNSEYTMVLRITKPISSLNYNKHHHYFYTNKLYTSRSLYRLSAGPVRNQTLISVISRRLENLCIELYLVTLLSLHLGFMVDLIMWLSINISGRIIGTFVFCFLLEDSISICFRDR